MHENPTLFIEIVENALHDTYHSDQDDRYEKVYNFYRERYLNPDSPERSKLIKIKEKGKKTKVFL